MKRDCKKCNKETLHDLDSDINDDVKTTITVCTECGEVIVDFDPVDICDICEHHECFDCPVINPINDAFTV